MVWRHDKLMNQILLAADHYKLKAGNWIMDKSSDSTPGGWKSSVWTFLKVPYFSSSYWSERIFILSSLTRHCCFPVSFLSKMFPLSRVCSCFCQYVFVMRLHQVQEQYKYSPHYDVPLCVILMTRESRQLVQFSYTLFLLLQRPQRLELLIWNFYNHLIE